MPVRECGGLGHPHLDASGKGPLVSTAAQDSHVLLLHKGPFDHCSLHQESRYGHSRLGCAILAVDWDDSPTPNSDHGKDVFWVTLPWV